MDCDKSLELLSDFRDGLLGDADRQFVDGHLADCHPCAGIFKDLDAIVATARSVSDWQEVSFPDEDAFWQRISVARSTIIH